MAYICYILGIFSYGATIVLGPLMILPAFIGNGINKSSIRKTVPYLGFPIISILSVAFLQGAYTYAGKTSLPLNPDLYTQKMIDFFGMEFKYIFTIYERIHLLPSILWIIPSVVTIAIILFLCLSRKIKFGAIKNINNLYILGTLIFLLSFLVIAKSDYMRGVPIGIDNRINIGLSLGLSIVIMTAIYQISKKKLMKFTLLSTIVIIYCMIQNIVTCHNYYQSSVIVDNITTELRKFKDTEPQLIILKLNHGIYNNESPVVYAQWDIDTMVKVFCGEESRGIVISDQSTPAVVHNRVEKGNIEFEKFSKVIYYNFDSKSVSTIENNKEFQQIIDSTVSQLNKQN